MSTVLIFAVRFSVEISLVVFIINVAVCKNHYNNYYAHNVIIIIYKLLTHGSDVRT